jgi:hypothetical protein
LKKASSKRNKSNIQLLFLLVFLECLFEAWKECVQIINLFGSFFSTINKSTVRGFSIPFTTPY